MVKEYKNLLKKLSNNIFVGKKAALTFLTIYRIYSRISRIDRIFG